MTVIEWRELAKTDRPGGPEGSDQFRVGVDKTISELDREAEWLGATHVRVHVDIPSRAYTKTGRPRLDTPAYSPGVVVDIATPMGWLRYGTAAYDSWQANLRAVVVSLEALRAVERHGVTHGQQYVGNLRELPAGPSTAPVPTFEPEPVHSVEDDARALAQATQHPRYADGEGWRKILDGEGDVDIAWGHARKVLHPDKATGDADRFKAISAAVDRLKAYHRARYATA